MDGYPQGFCLFVLFWVNLSILEKETLITATNPLPMAQKPWLLHQPVHHSSRPFFFISGVPAAYQMTFFPLLIHYLKTDSICLGNVLLF